MLPPDTGPQLVAHRGQQLAISSLRNSAATGPAAALEEGAHERDQGGDEDGEGEQREEEPVRRGRPPVPTPCAPMRRQRSSAVARARPTAGLMPLLLRSASTRCGAGRPRRTAGRRPVRRGRGSPTGNSGPAQGLLRLADAAAAARTQGGPGGGRGGGLRQLGAAVSRCSASRPTAAAARSSNHRLRLRRRAPDLAGGMAAVVDSDHQRGGHAPCPDPVPIGDPLYFKLDVGTTAVTGPSRRTATTPPPPAAFHQGGPGRPPGGAVLGGAVPPGGLDRNRDRETPPPGRSGARPERSMGVRVGARSSAGAGREEAERLGPAHRRPAAAPRPAWPRCATWLLTVSGETTSAAAISLLTGAAPARPGCPARARSRPTRPSAPPARAGPRARDAGARARRAARRCRYAPGAPPQRPGGPAAGPPAGRGRGRCAAA